jgi:hypothetical protein
VTSASGELLSVSPSISSIAFTNASHFWAPQEFPLLGIDLTCFGPLLDVILMPRIAVHASPNIFGFRKMFQLLTCRIGCLVRLDRLGLSTVVDQSVDHGDLHVVKIVCEQSSETHIARSRYTQLGI